MNIANYVLSLHRDAQSVFHEALTDNPYSENCLNITIT